MTRPTDGPGPVWTFLAALLGLAAGVASVLGWLELGRPTVGPAALLHPLAAISHAGFVAVFVLLLVEWAGGSASTSRMRRYLGLALAVIVPGGTVSVLALGAKASGPLPPAADIALPLLTASAEAVVLLVLRFLVMSAGVDLPERFRVIDPPAPAPAPRLLEDQRPRVIGSSKSAPAKPPAPVSKAPVVEETLPAPPPIPPPAMRAPPPVAGRVLEPPPPAAPPSFAPPVAERPDELPKGYDPKDGWGRPTDDGESE